ncbi:hypothetical protein PFISCL1PPCAC_10107, partial [Pristionchus fissidentatus]
GVILQSKRRVGLGCEIYKLMLVTEKDLDRNCDISRSINNMSCFPERVIPEIIASEMLESLDDEDNSV